MRKILFLIVKLCLITLIFYFIFRRIPVPRVLEAVSLSVPLWLAVALLLNGACRFIGAWQSSLLFKIYQVHLGTLAIFRISLASGFYGFLLPGEVGSGLVKWRMLSAPDNRKAEALTVILLTKSISFLFTLVLGLLGLLIENPFPSSSLPVFLICGLAFTLLLVALFFIPWFKRPLATMAVMLPSGFRAALSRSAFPGLLRSTQALPCRTVAGLLSLTALMHATVIVSLYFLALALAVRIPLPTFLWLNSVSILAQSIPLTVSGLGVREGAFLMLCHHYGIAAASMVAFSLCVFAINSCFSLLGGGIEAFLLFRNKWRKVQ